MSRVTPNHLFLEILLVGLEAGRHYKPAEVRARLRDYSAQGPDELIAAAVNYGILRRDAEGHLSYDLLDWLRQGLLQTTDPRLPHEAERHHRRAAPRPASGGLFDCRVPLRERARPADFRFDYILGGRVDQVPPCRLTPRAYWRQLRNPYPGLRDRAEATRIAYGTPAYAPLLDRLDHVTLTRQDVDFPEFEVGFGLGGIEFPDVANVAVARAALIRDPAHGAALSLLYTDPAGTGLIAFYAVPHCGNYQEHLAAIGQTLQQRYGAEGLVYDHASIRPGRAYPVVHDPRAWLQPSLRTQAKP